MTTHVNVLDRVGGDWVDQAAQAGLVARGIVYVISGVLVARVALGHKSDNPSRQGALVELAGHTYGTVLLVIIGVGLLLFALVCALGAIRGHGGKRSGGSDTKERVIDAGRAIVNVPLAFLAFKLVADGRSAAKGGSGKETEVTARVLNWPGGRVIVGVVGVAIVVAGIMQARKAITRHFTKGLDLDTVPPARRRRIEWLGVAGYAARGFVFALVGWFVIKAAKDHNSKDAVGIDGALRRLADATYGPWLLLLVAIGLVAFGLWSAVEGRYRRASG